MKIFPAIDLIKGKVVRLLKGDPESAKVYDHLGDPVAVAKKWEEEGADALHIIDLDAAFDRGNNLPTISRIAQTVSLPIHVGGGIRNIENAEKLLNLNVDKIIIGTLAFRKPEAITHLMGKYGDRIIIALDYAGDGKVMVEGWKKETALSIENALQKFLKLKVKTFLLTSIRKDGTLNGVDINSLSRVCNCSEAKIIAAGGVSGLKDLALLKRTGVYGVVIGKALYEGIFTLKDALRTVREA